MLDQLFSCFCVGGVYSFDDLKTRSSYTNQTIAVSSSISFSSGISLSGVIGLEVFGVSSSIILDGNISGAGMFNITNSAVIFQNLTFRNGQVFSLEHVF